MALAHARTEASAHASAARVVLDVRVVCGAGGGPEKTILNSPRFLDAKGYRNLCAYLHPPGDAGFEHLRRKAQALGATLLAVPDRGFWDWRVVGELLGICKRERVHTWHGHDYKSNALGLLLRRFWPMRLVTTVHGWVQHTWRTPLYYGIDRRCLSRYDKVICVSADLHEQCLAAGLRARDCVLIENGIDHTEFTRRLDPATAKKRLGLAADRLLVGAVGRLSPEKGFDLLIRAADRVLSQGTNFDLAIIGDGDERSRLEALIVELGRGGRIHWLGYRTDMRELYEAMDVFALSSLREGLPNVLLEALALEVPAMATRVAGVPSLIADGVNGLVVRPGSVDELSGALARLLTDPNLRARFARAGRQVIEDRYSFAARMEKVRAIYDALPERGARQRRRGTPRFVNI